MGFVAADRVKDTTATTGTGTYSLDESAPTGYQVFASGLTNGDTCHYCVTDGTDWEINEGVFSTGTPDTLTRGTLLDSSTGSAINWTAGSKDVFLVNSAERINRLMNAEFNAVPGTLPVATGLRGIAIGDVSEALEQYAIAIGYDSQAGQSSGGSTDTYATAVGYQAVAYESYCIAFGYQAVAGASAGTLNHAAVALGYLTDATAPSAVAIGDSAQATGSQTVALGASADAREQQCVAIGYSALAGQSAGGTTESQAVAIGNAEAYETGSIAIGQGATAGKSGSSANPYGIAIGFNSSAGAPTAGTPLEPSCIGIGNGANAYEENGIAIGTSATAGQSTPVGDSDAIAIGGSSTASAQYAIAIGRQSNVHGVYAIGIGYDAEARERHCISIGDGQAGVTLGGTTEEGAIGIGYLATAYEYGCVSIGYNSTAGASSGSTRPYAIAVGISSNSTAESAIAIGYLANTTGVESICLGHDNDASGDNAIAIGTQADAREDYNISIGWNGQVGYTTSGSSKTKSIGIGYQVNVYAEKGLAIGADAVCGQAATANAYGGIAIGPNAFVNHDNAIVMGEYTDSIRAGEFAMSIDHAATQVHRRGSIGMAIVTTDATATKLKVDLTGNDHVDMPSNAAMVISGLVVGYAPNKCAGYKIDAIIETYSSAGTTSIVGSTVTAIGEEDAAFDCTITADTTNGGFYIQVTGVAATTVEWSADIRFAESTS